MHFNCENHKDVWVAYSAISLSIHLKLKAGNQEPLSFRILLA